MSRPSGNKFKKQLIDYIVYCQELYRAKKTSKAFKKALWKTPLGDLQEHYWALC